MLRPCFFWRSHTYQHCDFLLGLLQLVYLHCSIWPPSANEALAFKPLIPFSAHFVFSPSAPSPPPHAPGCSSLPPASSSLPNSFMVLQWNAQGIHKGALKFYTSPYPVDVIYIQESNLNLSSSFWILCSAVRWHPLSIRYFFY